MRYAIVVGIMLLFSITIIWSMFKTTVVQAAEWNRKAEVESVIDDLNHFSKVNITLNNNKITVE